MMSDWDTRRPSLVFACDDTVATCGELVKRGVALIKEPQTMAWGTFASFGDLDGNELGLTDRLERRQRPESTSCLADEHMVSMRWI